MKPTIAQLLLKELEAEEAATRQCVERVPQSLWAWKPHDKSMQMGYLTVLVADMLKWITAMIEEGEINFMNWESYANASLTDVTARFDRNMAGAKKALQNATDEALQG